jgi:hypothetical protein
MRNLKEISMFSTLHVTAATAATTATGAGKDWGVAIPRRVMAGLLIHSGAASHTLAVEIDGSNDNAAWTQGIASIAATDTAAASNTFVDLGQKQYLFYRARVTSAGAFGGGQSLRALVVLVGIDPRNMPTTHV